MNGRVMLALGLGLRLVGSSGEAHAWAPKQPRPRVSAPDDVDATVEDELTPPSDDPDAEALDPALDDPALDEGDDSTDPAGDESEAALEPATDDADPEPPASDEPAAATHDVPADDFENESGVAPGGYYGHGMILERPPPDGRNRIIVGSILLPLGTIATVSSAVGTWMTVPSHCAERLGAAGIEASAARCQGLFTFNVVRTTYGLLMLGSGATILALGMIQRERYRKWRHEHGMTARVEPTFDVTGRSASLGLRVQF